MNFYCFRVKSFSTKRLSICIVISVSRFEIRVWFHKVSRSRICYDFESRFALQSFYFLADIEIQQSKSINTVVIITFLILEFIWFSEYF